MIYWAHKLLLDSLWIKAFLGKLLWDARPTAADLWRVTSDGGNAQGMRLKCECLPAGGSRRINEQVCVSYEGVLAVIMKRCGETLMTLSEPLQAKHISALFWWIPGEYEIQNFSYCTYLLDWVVCCLKMASYMGLPNKAVVLWRLCLYTVKKHSELHISVEI